MILYRNVNPTLKLIVIKVGGFLQNMTKICSSRTFLDLIIKTRIHTMHTVLKMHTSNIAELLLEY